MSISLPTLSLSLSLCLQKRACVYFCVVLGLGALTVYDPMGKKSGPEGVAVMQVTSKDVASLH